MKSLRLTVYSFMAFAFLIGCDSSQRNTTAGIQHITPVVTAIVPLTGSMAKYGEAAKEGMELAEAHFKEKYPSIRYRILYSDDKGETSVALSVFEQSVLRDHPVAVLGPIPSGTTRALLPKLEASRLPAVTPTSTSPNLRGASPYLFRTCVSDDLEAMAVAEFAAKSLSRPEMAVLYINNEYGKSLKDVFIKKYASLNGKIVFDEGYPPDTKDFRSMLTKPALKSAGAVFIIGQDEQAQLISQIGERGLQAKILGTTMFEDSKILALSNSDGVIFSYRSFDPERADPVVRRFVSDYKSRYSKEPNFFASSSYDAATVALNAIKYVSSNPGVDMATALRLMPPLDGVNGPLRFDEKNDVMQRFGIKSIKQGAYIWVDRPF